MACKKIAVVGLGLIGGSVLKALQGFEQAVFFGIDMQPGVIEQAEKEGLIQNQDLSNDEMLACADVVFVCLPPDATISFVNENKFKNGALVTDVCGVKRAILEKIQNPDIDFVGGHPMAGKETSGFAASEANLFQNAVYLLTPQPHNEDSHIELLKRMIAYMGCRETVMTTPAEHDDMIAYTSQLMHVVAVTLCDNQHLDRAKSFSAGSLRDCTRVAKLDSKLWTRLFLHNKSALHACIEEFETSLNTLKELVIEEDEQGLESYLSQCSDRKKKFFEEQ